MWSITKETDRIVYANKFNHRKELHLQVRKCVKPTLDDIISPFNRSLTLIFIFKYRLLFRHVH